MRQRIRKGKNFKGIPEKTKQKIQHQKKLQLFHEQARSLQSYVEEKEFS